MALIEGCKHSLDLTVPVEAVAAETEKVVDSVRKKAHLPGFRPGKAPASFIRQRFKAQIEQEVVENLLPRHLREEVEKQNLQLVGQPSASKVHYHDGQPLTATVEFEVAPTFELGETRDLEVEYEEPSVAPEEIEKRLEALREDKAEYVNLDPRPVEDGDHTLIDMESAGGLDGPPIKQEDLAVEVGHADTFPSLSEGLRGAVPGDVREVEITYPENYQAERLAGKTVQFKLHLKAIRRKELPELNDEFAKDLGDFQTLDELREEIRKGQFREREYAAQTTAKNSLVDKLVDAHEFPVPEVWIEQQSRAILERQLGMMAQQGVDVSKLKLDWSALLKAQREKAIREVRASLLLEKIADRESIFPLNEEVDKEVQRIARQEKEPVAATRKRLQEDGTLGRIANRIKTEKTLSFLFEHARKVAPAPKPEAEEPSNG